MIQATGKTDFIQKGMFVSIFLKLVGKISQHEIVQLQTSEVHVVRLVAGSMVTCAQAIPICLPVGIHNLLDINRWRMVSSVNRRLASVLRIPGIILDSKFKPEQIS